MVGVRRRPGGAAVAAQVGRDHGEPLGQAGRDPVPHGRGLRVAVQQQQRRPRRRGAGGSRPFGGHRPGAEPLEQRHGGQPTRRPRRPRPRPAPGGGPGWPPGRCAPGPARCRRRPGRRRGPGPGRRPFDHAGGDRAAAASAIRSSPCGVPNNGSNRSPGSSASGEEAEDPAPVVVAHDQDRPRGRPAAPSRPEASCSRARSPQRAATGSSSAAATPSAVATNPSIPDSPRLATNRSPSVAGRTRPRPDRHAGADHQRPPGRHPADQVAGHPPLERLGPLVQQPVDRLLAARSASSHSRSQGPERTRGGPSVPRPGAGPWAARRVAVAARRAEGSAVRRRVAVRPGSSQPAEGSTTTWPMDSSSQAVRALLGAAPTRTARVGR